MKKFNLLFVSLLLVVVALISPMLITRVQIDDFIERDINVGEIGALSYEEKVEQMLSKFDNYSSYIDNEGNYVFDAECKNGYIDGLDFLSSNNSSYVKKYSAKLDGETEKFYLTISVWNEDCMISSKTIQSQPYYDEVEDEYFIDIEDGETIRVSEVINYDGLEECSALVIAAGASVGTVVAGMLIVYAVTQEPVITKTIETTVKTVVVTVVSWVKSFAKWLRKLWKKVTRTETRTYEETRVIENITYRVDLKIGDATITAELSDYDSMKEKIEAGVYYLAIGDTWDNKLYISKQSVNELVAKSVLLSPNGIWINSAHKECRDSKYVLSIYTQKQSTAFNLASEAAKLIGNPSPSLHTAVNGSGHYDHYHHVVIGRKEHTPHVFFGNKK